MRFPAALALALLATPAAAQPDPAADFTRTNDRSGTVFTREAGGLRVRTPPALVGLLARQPNLYTADTEYAVGGDFEFSAAYSVAAIGAKGKPPAGEGNVELGVHDRGPRGHMGVNVNADAIGRHVNVVRVHPNRGGTHFNVLSFPRKADTGRVTVRRRGAELVFLHADGDPAGPLVELVRYPHDPLVNPNLRVSAFTGTGPAATPVDVLLTDLKVTAARFARGAEAQAVLPPAPPPAAYPVTVSYGPNSARLLADFTKGNDGGRAFRADGAAVRVNPAAGPPKKDGGGYWYRESRFALAGDFEVSWRLDVAALGPLTGAGYGSCAVGLTFETGTPVGSVSLCRGLGRDGPRFAVTRYSPAKNARGASWDTQAVNAPAGAACRFVARRVGAELTLLTADGADAPLTELVRMPFTPGPVRDIRLMVDQGGTTLTPVDVILSDLVVKAGKVYDPANPAAVAVAAPTGGAAATAEPVVLDAAPVAKSRKWRYLGVGFGAVLAVGLTAGGVAVVLTRRMSERK